MTSLVNSLQCIEGEFDVAVLDQYGVLHDGRTPCKEAVEALAWLEGSGKSVAVLSNSGKRALVNRSRIRALGVPLAPDVHVETSGETAWHEFDNANADLPGRPPRRLLPIAAVPEDALDWAAGNRGVAIVEQAGNADAVLLMGMPRPEVLAEVHEMLETALTNRTPLVCTNPDTVSPLGPDRVPSPGSLAERFAERGGRVSWFGKPHRKMFDAVRRLFPDIPRNRFAMVGDSIAHDVAGARGAGFRSVFVRSGIHAADFEPCTCTEEIMQVLEGLAARHDGTNPDWSMDLLR